MSASANLFINGSHAMLTELTVSNYRSLGPDITLRFGKISVLVGANGSGKSNLLDVLTFVRDAIRQGLPAAITSRDGIDAVRRRSEGRPFNVKIGVKALIDHQEHSYAFELTGDRQEEYRVKSETALTCFEGKTYRYKREGGTFTFPDDVNPSIDEQSLFMTSLSGDPRLARLSQLLADTVVYAIYPDALRPPQRFSNTTILDRRGERWVSVLRDCIKNPNFKSDLIKALYKITGDIDDIKVSSAAGYLIAEFKHETQRRGGKKWFAAAQQSDGTLRIAGLLTALLQAERIPVIGIEEPELTVHPGVLPLLYDYIQQAAQTSQIILTTHSPVLLDVLDLDQTDIFVVTRQQGETQIVKLTDAQIEPTKKHLMSLGDMLIEGALTPQQDLFEGLARQPNPA